MEYFSDLSFNFGQGVRHEGSDKIIITNVGRKISNYDYIIFTDSKGLANNENDYKISWGYQLFEKLSIKKLSVLFISRPLVLTTFFTLINFFERNNNSCKHLITNLGFVDCTPKKKEFIDDLLIQAPKLIKSRDLNLFEMGEYTLNDGSTEMLYSIDYRAVINVLSTQIAKFAFFTHLITTIEFKSDLKISRKRPDSFYLQLKKTNQFLKEISNTNSRITLIKSIVDSQKFTKPEDLTYDAVHFTKLGHQILFNEMMNKLFANESI